MPAPKWYRVVTSDGVAHWYRSSKKAMENHPNHIIEQYASKDSLSPLKSCRPDMGMTGYIPVADIASIQAQRMSEKDIPIRDDPERELSPRAARQKAARERKKANKGKWPKLPAWLEEDDPNVPPYNPHEIPFPPELGEGGKRFIRSSRPANRPQSKVILDTMVSKGFDPSKLKVRGRRFKDGKVLYTIYEEM